MKRCLANGCDRYPDTVGYCQKHYKRLRNNGSPYIIKCEDTRGVPPYDRIMKKVVVDKKTGCWNFAGRLQRGYGYIRADNRFVRVHRFMYEYHKGKIPNGKFVCHSCDNPKCCNPEHLWVGTHNDNMRDREEKGRNGGHIHKLTRRDAELIRKMHSKYTPGRGYKGWCTYQFLANEFGVTKATIMRVLTMGSHR